jgi:hypothetical protein
VESDIPVQGSGAGAATWSIPTLGRPAHVAAAWAAAGGSAAGVLLAALLLLGRLHPDGSVFFAVVLAVTGSVLGLVHGAILGYLGRGEAGGPVRGLLDRGYGAVTIVMALLGSWALAIWLVMSAVLLRSGSVWGWPALLAGGAAAAAAAGWATLVGWRSLEAAYTAWPDHRIGSGLAGGSFLVLCLALFGVRPAIPGTSLELPLVAWVLIAAIATIWIAMPAIVVALRAARRRPAASGGESVPGSS